MNDLETIKSLCIQDIVALNIGCTRGKESDEVDDGEDWVTIWISPDGSSWSYTPVTFIRNHHATSL